MARSSTPLISAWHPDVTYNFKLKIGESDYSTDVQRILITSGINVPYQTVLIDLFIDSRDILREQLFGQENIKLTIQFKGKEPAGFADDIKMELLYISIDSDYSPVQQNYMTDQWERTIVTLKTIPIDAYKTMTTMVNEIYFNKTPADIISDLVSNNTSAKLDYDSQGQSDLKIDQMIIPPTTLYNVVNYIDRTYGLFNGPMATHCNFENTLKIQNLNTKVRTAQKFTLYLLATDKDQEDIFDNDDPTIFYTRNSVANSYEGNSVFGVKAPSEVYIVKPRNSLFGSLDISLESFAKEHGVIEKNNPKIFFNKEAMDENKRIVVVKDHTGYDLDKTFINANLSHSIKELAVTMGSLQGNLALLNLVEVGEHIKIISHVDEHIKLSGSYILKASEIQFIKAQGWEAQGNIYMVRTNVAQQ